MGDVVFLAILVAFFALAALFVRACDRLIGHETEAVELADATVDAEIEAA